jgi:hypothetical protein
MKPEFVNLLRAYGVTHILTPLAARHPGLTLVASEPTVYVYRVEGAARVRVVPAARPTGDADAVVRMRSPGFDPNQEILLHGAPASVQRTVDGARGVSSDDGGGSAAITYDDGHELVVDAVTPDDGFLLVADTYYPGWRARVDGVDTPIYRANVSVRGIALPKGRHTVRFTYEASSFFRGFWITLVAVCALLLWFGVALYRHA